EPGALRCLGPVPGPLREVRDHLRGRGRRGARERGQGRTLIRTGPAGCPVGPASLRPMCENGRSMPVRKARQIMSNNALKALSESGVSVWLDDISRERLRTGNLAKLMSTHRVAGVTSHPTIVDEALAEGDAYDELVHDLALRGVSLDEAVRLLTAYDIRSAADTLRPVHEDTERKDGRVSLEVDPRLAGDTESTIAEAKSLRWLIERPDLKILIPSTAARLYTVH